MKYVVALFLVMVYASIWYGIVFIPLSPLRSVGCAIASFPILYVLSVISKDD